MKTAIMLLVAATLAAACEPMPTPDPLTVEPFCETAYSVPTPYRGCTTIVGDFIVARSTSECVVDPVRYSCLSTTDEVYVRGEHEVVDVVAAVDGCAACDGKTETLITENAPLVAVAQ